MSGKLSIGGRVRSFGHALRGVGLVVRTQPNAWIHALATVAVLAAGLFFSLSVIEWCLVVLTVLAVWIAEALNTAIERLGDAVSPEHHPLVGQAKDVAAGAVLIAAGGSVVVGALIFGPRLLNALLG